MISNLNIQVKDVVIYEGAEYQISQVTKNEQILLESTSGGDCFLVSVNELLTKYADRQLVIVPFESRDQRTRIGEVRPTAPEPSAGKDVRARIRQILLQEFDRNPVPLSDKSLNKFIATASLSKDLDQEGWRPSAGTMRRDIKKRGASGHRPMSLMKRKQRAGCRSPFRPETRFLMSSIARWFYAARHRSISDAYAKFCRLHAYLESRECRRLGMTKKWKRPSYETLRVEIRQSESFEFVEAKYGVKEARRRYSGVGEGMRADRPLDIVMIDATVVDTLLVYDGDGETVLGRPTLTIGIDVCTRMIVGLFISFEPPSIYSVMNCVKDILTPKSDRFSSPHQHSRSLAYVFGKPFLIIVDNGLENVGSSFQDSMRDLNMNVEWAPVKTPTYKAIVERFFDTLNKNVFHKLGGAVPYGVKEMREREIDPAKSACMTLQTLRDVVNQFIAEIYQMQMHSGIGVAPRLKWNELSQKNGIDIIQDLSAIDDACGYVKEAVLTRKGIETEGLVFNDQMTTSLLLKDLIPLAPRGRNRRATNSVRVKIKFDPSDISSIRVWNGVSGQYVHLPNTHSAYAAGTSLGLHRILKKKAIEEQQAFFSDDERYAAKSKLLRSLERGSFRELGRKSAKRYMPQRSNASPIVETEEASPRHDGNAPLVPVELGMEKRTDCDTKPDGFLRGRKKALATKREKKKRKIQEMREVEHALSNSRTNFSSVGIDDPVSFMASVGDDWDWEVSNG